MSVCLTAGDTKDLHSVTVYNQQTGSTISTAYGRVQAERLKSLLFKVP